jgi:hypothetical protein
MAVIQIPDDQAVALQAKAAAQGLTLEAWLKSLKAAKGVTNLRTSSHSAIPEPHCQKRTICG